MNKMEKDSIIYSLVKKVLFNNDNVEIPDLSEKQWEEVYMELKEQAVSTIPAEWVFQNTMLPETLLSTWKRQYISQVAFYCQLLYEENELVNLMSLHNIPMVILKGVAAAMYYPQPTLRLMGDIDFLVLEDDFQTAYNLMLSHGYSLKYKEDHVDYHITLQKGKFTYEIHRQPAGMPGGKEGEYLSGLLKNGLNSISKIRLEDYEIPILPSIQNGIVLLLHIVKHLKNGLGLRQIIDWMMYVDKELHDDNWYNNIEPILQKTQYVRLAKVVTRMCQIYLGLQQTDITWCEDIDNSVCERLMDYVMEQGNFGLKVREEDKGVRIFSQIHNPIQFFSFLQKKGEKKWNILQRYPIFQPFAWCYMLFTYITKAICRNSPIRNLFLDVNIAKDRKQLFEDMGIFLKE